MKALPSSHLLALFSLFASLGLIGCSGTFSLPDTQLTTQVNGPSIKGSAFGGHAPLVGMHVYLVQPSTAGYGKPAISLLGNNNTSSAAGYGFTTNTSDPGVPTTVVTGATVKPMYETSDANGGFDFTGGFTCTAGQPVYVYGFGGSPISYTGSYTTATAGTSSTPYTGAISKIVVSNVNFLAGTATYAITIPAAALTVGQPVKISGVGQGFEGQIGGNQNVVTATTVGASTTFTISASDFLSGIGQGTYTPGGSVAATITTATTTYTPTTNPIVELATLGNCPASGNFSGSTGYISYLYMNEVSTIATAYTFQPFTAATNNSAWDIGTPGGSALTGIENAANTAGQIYDIQGRGAATSTPASEDEGEGHIANATTPLTLGGVPNTGEGTVPQETVDTLANILAACIDSAVQSTQTGQISTACSMLFSTATSNGQSGGDSPTDTAAAAINIARYPAGYDAGSSTSYVDALFSIPTGDVPYAPDLSTAPKGGGAAPGEPANFQIIIGYANPGTIPGGGAGIGETNGQSPHAVAVDSLGDIYAVNTTGNALNILTPLGELANSVGTSSAGPLNGPVSVALNYSSATGAAADVWVANTGGELSEFTATTATTTGGAAEAHSTVSNKGLEDAQIDGSGNIWVTTGDPYLVELSSTGGVQNTSAKTGLSTPIGVAIEPVTSTNTGEIWVANSGSNDATLFHNVAGGTGRNGYAADTYVGEYAGNNSSNCPGNDVYTPNGVAIDANGDVWLTDASGCVSELTSAGGKVTGSPFAAGSQTSEPLDGIAIDGGDNVWVASPNDQDAPGTIHEYTDGGVQISPANGYAFASGSADAIAIDGSGNIWCTSASTANIYEVVGAALPVVTPLSLAVRDNLLGQTPTSSAP